MKMPNGLCSALDNVLRPLTLQQNIACLNYLQSALQLPVQSHRILLDRLWPMGVPEVKAKIDLWVKEIAPGDNLRK